MKFKCNCNICAIDISKSTTTSTSCKGIHLNHPTDSDASKPGHPNRPAEPSGHQKGQQQQSRGQSISFVVADNQQAEPSRPLTFTLTPMNQFNPLSVVSAPDAESHDSISGLSGFFWNLPSTFFGNILSVLSYQQIGTPQLTGCLSSNHHRTAAAKQQPNSSSSRTTALASNQSFSGPHLSNI